jgi:hypothetical protein
MSFAVLMLLDCRLWAQDMATALLSANSPQKRVNAVQRYQRQFFDAVHTNLTVFVRQVLL